MEWLPSNFGQNRPKSEASRAPLENIIFVVGITKYDTLPPLGVTAQRPQLRRALLSFTVFSSLEFMSRWDEYSVKTNVLLTISKSQTSNLCPSWTRFRCKMTSLRSVWRGPFSLSRGVNLFTVSANIGIFGVGRLCRHHIGQRNG